ncbi:hypothetical protein K461DRAFT_51841 [Myriangium duriaei CBS 260.36]|uniref:Uncharacterized protein n=1 Tax=Myriangium duriaei CBS 260.36 TaxID=1168546 RepID=A0A9P4MCG1_9PEZI|nr:hypothetical protein K461DRAFT_51841 [Myriangium duriaei CBS 260.36]
MMRYIVINHSNIPGTWSAIPERPWPINSPSTIGIISEKCSTQTSKNNETTDILDCYQKLILSHHTVSCSAFLLLCMQSRCSGLSISPRRIGGLWWHEKRALGNFARQWRGQACRVTHGTSQAAEREREGRTTRPQSGQGTRALPIIQTLLAIRRTTAGSLDNCQQLQSVSLTKTSVMPQIMPVHYLAQAKPVVQCSDSLLFCEAHACSFYPQSRPLLSPSCHSCSGCCTSPSSNRPCCTTVGEAFPHT